MKNKKSLFLVTTLAVSQLAYGQASTNPGDPLLPAASPTTIPSPTTAKLKNPVVLRDGKLTELPGEWLFTKDGTAVFAQTVPLVLDTREPIVSEGTQSFVILVPASSGNAPYLQYDQHGAGWVNAAYPNYYTRRQYNGWSNGYYGTRNHGFYRTYPRSWGPNYVRLPNGFVRLAPNRHLGW